MLNHTGTYFTESECWNVDLSGEMLQTKNKNKNQGGCKSETQNQFDLIILKQET